MTERQKPEIPVKQDKTVTKPKSNLLRRIGYAAQNVALATHPGGAALLASGVGAEEIHNMTDRTPEINPKPVESQTSTETPNQSPTEASKSFMSEFRKGLKDGKREFLERRKKRDEMTEAERRLDEEALNQRSIFNHFNPTARGLGKDAFTVAFSLSTGAGGLLFIFAKEDISSGHYKEAMIKGLIGAALEVPFILGVKRAVQDLRRKKAIK